MDVLRVDDRTIFIIAFERVWIKGLTIDIAARIGDEELCFDGKHRVCRDACYHLWVGACIR